MTKPVIFELDADGVERLTAIKVMAGKDSLRETLAVAIRVYEWFLTQQKAGNTIHVASGNVIREVTLK